MSILQKMKQRSIRKAYEAKLTEARNAQRNGKIQVYADLMVAAEELRKQLDDA